VNHTMRRRYNYMVSKAEFRLFLLSVWALPVSGPGGTRRRVWRDLIAGFCRERENLSLRCQGSRTNSYIYKCQSTNAKHRGGVSRSSVDRPVMGQEPRGYLIQSYNIVNQRWEEQCE
jgi:hypothetical protein